MTAVSLGLQEEKQQRNTAAFEEAGKMENLVQKVGAGGMTNVES